jgi:hypothetical protein
LESLEHRVAEDRRTVLKRVFAERLRYGRENGFRTADLSLPFRLLGAFGAGEKEMARPAGGSIRVDLHGDEDGYIGDFLADQALFLAKAIERAATLGKRYTDTINRLEAEAGEAAE